MRQSFTTLALGALLGGLTACTSGNSAVEPNITSVNTNTLKLQFTVGVATLMNGVKGLNVVATFRQANGLSATLVNTPLLTGPAGFLNTASAGTCGASGAAGPLKAGVDSGTSQISGSPQVPFGGPAPICTTFGQPGGIFAYGFAPANASTNGAAQFGVYSQPFYVSGANRMQYVGGPPAYPQVTNGQFPKGFLGYPQGWMTFNVPPVGGTYNLSATIQTSTGGSSTFTAPSATLNNTVGLAAFAAGPTFTQDGNGGGTATCTTPPGTTETIVDLQNQMTGTFFTIVQQGGGVVNAVFPANLGPQGPQGQTSPTLNPGTAGPGTGDAYAVQCIALDYPAFEAGPPQNTQQFPQLAGPSGQSDLAFSPVFSNSY